MKINYFNVKRRVKKYVHSNALTYSGLTLYLNTSVDVLPFTAQVKSKLIVK